MPSNTYIYIDIGKLIDGNCYFQGPSLIPHTILSYYQYGCILSVFGQDINDLLLSS